MKIIRSILAIIAGYILLSVLAVGTTLALRSVVPAMAEQPLSLNHSMLTLACIAVFALIAGYVAAVIARGTEFGTAVALGGVCLLLGIVAAFSASSDGREVWFPGLNGALQFVGASLGGYLRARQVPAEREPSEAEGSFSD